MLDGLTLDQMRMLIAVVDEGSFTKAGGRVQRAQSAVSHAIASLEFQLDLALFDRTTRKPTLTPAGEAILADARTVIDRVDALKARAASLRVGVEPSLGLAVSLLLPQVTLNAVIADFVEDFPQTDLDLIVQEASGPLDAVTNDRVDIGIVGAFNLRGTLADISQIDIGRIEVVAVAAPMHKLAQLGRQVTIDDLQNERQLTSANAMGEGTADPLSRAVWPIADQSLRRAMLCQGFGWGIVPKHLVAADLTDGLLLEIDVEVLGDDTLNERIVAVHRRTKPLGKAGASLIEALSQSMAQGA